MPISPRSRRCLKNPWIWILCVANIFEYVIRIGIDNWAPLYVTEALHFDAADAVNTIFYFEIGALVASLLWGYVSDLLKGRRALVAMVCMVLIVFVVGFYKNVTSVGMVNISLWGLGALIFGPQLLIGVLLVGFVPKRAVSVANGMAGTFTYLFGDSMAGGWRPSPTPKQTAWRSSAIYCTVGRRSSPSSTLHWAPAYSSWPS
jgi:OPA family hexose phosphate transport protein UhpT-like MFS transporter